MKTSIILDNKRKGILKELESSKKKFVELKKIMNLESNLLSYNLNILIQEGLVEKKSFYYSLSQKAKYLMPYIRDVDNFSSVPMACVATIVKKGSKILIRKMGGEPGKGKRIFIGGKVLFGEDIFDACRRHVKSKVGIDVKDLRLLCINNYFSKNRAEMLHFIVFFVIAKPVGTPINAEWKSSVGIRGKMYPDNRFILKEMLNNRKVKILTSIYNEQKDSFKVVNVS